MTLPHFRTGDRVRLSFSGNRGTVKHGTAPGSRVIFVILDDAKYESADMLLDVSLEMLPVIDQLAALADHDA